MKVYEILETTCYYLESCRDELLEDISDGALEEYEGYVNFMVKSK